MKYCLLIFGQPASGKSTFCETAGRELRAIKGGCCIVDLNLAAKGVPYTPSLDFKKFLSDKGKEKELKGNEGPLQNWQLLIENRNELRVDLDKDCADCIIFDCPAIPDHNQLQQGDGAVRIFVEAIRSWDYTVCSLYVTDFTRLIDPLYFCEAIQTTLEVVLNLQTRCIMVVMKMDKIGGSDREKLNRLINLRRIDNILDGVKETRDNRHRLASVKIWISKQVDFRMPEIMPLDTTDWQEKERLSARLDRLIHFDEQGRADEHGHVDEQGHADEQG